MSVSYHSVVLAAFAESPAWESILEFVLGGVIGIGLLYLIVRIASRR
ncbi:hypothetical protein [Aciditerrimonas ferrireducens]|nr:hypothetical protein [Aciditerrimonas ferrireducens]MCK4178040.1 hypothetical protein [Aciditerrimonas ferrireducens]